MISTRILTGTIAAALVTSAMATAACRGGEKADEKNTPPSAQIAATSEQAMNRPVTVDGCLRAGEGGSTFVLTSEQAETGNQPATYHLVGGTNVQLAQHVGQRVSVTGILQGQQHATTQTPTTTSEKATGTSGTPAVTTETDVTVRTLDVNGIQPLGGGRCDKDK